MNSCYTINNYFHSYYCLVIENYHDPIQNLLIDNRKLYIIQSLSTKAPNATNRTFLINFPTK